VALSAARAAIVTPPSERFQETSFPTACEINPELMQISHSKINSSLLESDAEQQDQPKSTCILDFK